MAIEGEEWQTIQEMESNVCKDTHANRNRLITENDARVRQPPFVIAAFVRKNNKPKYYALLLRAEEHAKPPGKYILWFAAYDKRANPQDIRRTPAAVEKQKKKISATPRPKDSGHTRPVYTIRRPTRQIHGETAKGQRRKHSETDIL